MVFQDHGLDCAHAAFPFPAFPCQLGAVMITGQQLRDARSRAGWTQHELANRIGATLRSVGNWERGSVPANREGMLREILGEYLEGAAGNPLADVSDVALLAEVGRRMARGGQANARPINGEKSRPAGGRREDYDLTARTSRGPHRKDLPDDFDPA